ncbi:MAG: hypothetical protein JWL80_107 [Parcubacteria group bacterium]|nr:hypothetical protein [Parcubacteria group bacterium]
MSPLLYQLSYPDNTRHYNTKSPIPQDTLVVAGPGLAPGSGGYEPPEILLLYPAITPHYILFSCFRNFRLP